MEEALLEKRKEKLKKQFFSWIKKPHNFALAGILIFSFFIRMYYFFLTKGQAHWWDSLAYGSMAKEFIFHRWSENGFLLHEFIIRPPLLPFLWSILMRLNLSEFFSMFLLQIIPSFLSVVFIYLIGKQLFNKKIALISSFFMAVLWINLFYSVRMLTGVPSLTLILMSIYFFLKFDKKMEIKNFALSIFFLSLAVLMRYPSGLVGFVYVLFLFSTKKFSFLKNKSFWIGGILGIIPLISFFIRNILVYETLFPAVETYSKGAESLPSYAFYTLSNLIPHILQKFLLIFFILGLLIILFRIILSFGFYSKIRSLRSDLFVFLLLLVPLLFFIFWLKAAEDRYLFICLPSIIFLVSRGISYPYNLVKKYNKNIAVVLLVLVLITGAYSQISFANTMIESKKTSYLQMKQAFLWINENTPEDAVLLGDAIDPYTIYYAERGIAHWNKTDLQGSLSGVDYIIIHGFEHQSVEVLDYVNINLSSKLSPVNAVFFDQEQKQPAVIIYKINEQ